MYISHITIKNLRALEDIDFPLGKKINVICGPNAVGKTTIIQACRLIKGLLAPRTPNETQQVLISLGAASPHYPQRIFLNNLARDVERDIEIRCTFGIDDEETNAIQVESSSIIKNVVAGEVGQKFANPANLAAFFQSPQGISALASTAAEFEISFDKVKSDKALLLSVVMNAVKNNIHIADRFSGQILSFLEQRLPIHISNFSYFPADRALPMGEVQLQLGAPEAQQQLESHNSQPQNKYLRLKNLIVNALVVGDGEKKIHDDFELIFSGLLRGRKIKSISINEFGLLSVMTEDVSTGSLIELDNLSSGEKNIALTFLIVARSVSEKGIALFDEPELHLNPAVSRDLLPFMLENYCAKKQIQFIMCTHSPEILSGAFLSDDCNLYHLKSSTNITRVGKRALNEYADALQRLGTSVSETLLFEGTVLVEGVDDVVFLREAFPEFFKNLQLSDRGGRREIEKAVEEIQKLEAAGQKVSPIYLIFDLDDQTTKLHDSENVRILQWKRRSIENYMLDTDVITSILNDAAVSQVVSRSEGDIRNQMRDLALAQLDEIAAREVYKVRGYLSPSLRGDDVKSGDISIIAGTLFKRMSEAQKSMPSQDENDWKDEFIRLANHKARQMKIEWEGKWPELCDGKKLLSVLHKSASMKISENAFKVRIIREMRDQKSENWRLVQEMLTELFSARTR